MNDAKTNCILTADVVKRKVRRMALEIAERNTGESTLYFAGISGNGELVAHEVMKELKQLTEADLQYVTITINKKQPLEVHIDKEIDFNQKVIIIVDDVMDSGCTMLFSIKPFLESQPKSIQTLVLVERSHKLFPVQTDYVGLSLATTLQEHIRVVAENGVITGAWLH